MASKLSSTFPWLGKWKKSANLETLSDERAMVYINMFGPVLGKWPTKQLQELVLAMATESYSSEEEEYSDGEPVVKKTSTRDNSMKRVLPTIAYTGEVELTEYLPTRAELKNLPLFLGMRRKPMIAMIKETLESLGDCSFVIFLRLKFFGAGRYRYLTPMEADIPSARHEISKHSTCNEIAEWVDNYFFDLNAAGIHVLMKQHDFKYRRASPVHLKVAATNTRKKAKC